MNPERDFLITNVNAKRETKNIMKDRNIAYTGVLMALGFFALAAVCEAKPPSRLTSVLYDFGSPPFLTGRVFFTEPPFVVGTAIRKSDDATFILNQDGVYRVTYSIQVFQCAVLEAQLQVAGIGVGPVMVSSCANEPTPITDQVTFTATAGSTVQIVLNDVGAVGRAASINIDKLR